jgi:tripartite-type tricarboxylate transporter receptor subunit TctC
MRAEAPVVKRIATLWMVIAVLLLGAASHAADLYPTKPVRLILPFPPSGGTDTLGRGIAQTLSLQLGQPVIADNRPGAGGNLGLEIAAKAPPDGYTMVLSSPLIAIGPVLFAKLNFDAEKELAPVTMLGLAPELPTAAEAGFPGVTDDTWYGMFVPAATPRAIIDRLNRELHKTLAAPELVQRLETAGIETRTSTPEELGRLVKTETARFGKVIRRAGMKPL